MKEQLKTLKMAKKVELKENSAGGIDLLTERDSGNEVLILTGNKENSLKFWKELQKKADEAVESLENG